MSGKNNFWSYVRSPLICATIQLAMKVKNTKLYVKCTGPILNLNILVHSNTEKNYQTKLPRPRKTEQKSEKRPDVA